MKKLLCGILLALCLCISLCGCKNYNDHTENGFTQCVGYTNLHYDNNTRIVYYIFQDKTVYGGIGYMSPYISENGKFCKWVDNQIKEIK